MSELEATVNTINTYNVIQFHKNYKFTKIVHMADIHIKNDLGRIEEYETVFTNLYAEIKKQNMLVSDKQDAVGGKEEEQPPQKKRMKLIQPIENLSSTAIVIAGDIFDHARKDGKLSPMAILTFKKFIRNLGNLGVVIMIPGNHDNNITFKSSYDMSNMDALSCVLHDMEGMNKRIFYLKDTGIYKLGNLLLYHTSVFDIDKLTKYEDYLQFLHKRRTDYLQCHHIYLLHCGIQTQKLSSGYVLNNYAYELKDIQDFDMFLLGDTHQYQLMGARNNGGYPNSLVQQNHGETLNRHGFIWWDIATRQGKLIEVKNPYGFVTIYSKNNLQDITEIIQNTIFPPKSRIKYVIQCANEEEEIDQDQIRQLVDIKTQVVGWKLTKIFTDTQQNSGSNLHDINNTDKFIAYLKTKFDENSKEYLYCKTKGLEDIQKHQKEIGRFICYPKILKVTNFQGYENKHVLLDFNRYKHHSTISIGGKNASGKSTIIRALNYAIWGPKKGQNSTYINYDQKECKVSFIFIHDGTEFKITRTLERSGKKFKTNCELKKMENGNWNNLHKKYTKDTQRQIDQFFGKRDDAILTWLSEQDGQSNFIDDRNNYDTFQRFVGADLYKKIYDEHEKEWKLLKRSIENSENILSSIEVANSDEIKLEIDQFQKQKMDLEILLEKENELLNAEKIKLKYGTFDEFNLWHSNVNRFHKKIQTVKKNLAMMKPISNEEYLEFMTNVKNKIFLNTKQKEILLASLPNISNEEQSKFTQKYLIKLDKKQFEQDKIMLELKTALNLQDNFTVTTITYKIGELNNKLVKLKSNKKEFLECSQKLEKMESQLKKIILEIDSEKHLKLITQCENVSNKNIISTQRLNGFEIGKDVGFNQEITNIECEIKKLEAKHAKSKTQCQKLITTSPTKPMNQTTNHGITEQEDITEHYNTLLKLRKELGDQKSKLTILQYKRDNIVGNLSKFKELCFSLKCRSCDKNKKYFKIDQEEAKLKTVKEEIHELEYQLSETRKKITELKIYEMLRKNWQEKEKHLNTQKILKLQISNKKGELAKLEKKMTQYLELAELLKEHKTNTSNFALWKKELENINKKISKKTDLEKFKTTCQSKLDFLKYDDFELVSLTESLQKYSRLSKLFQVVDAIQIEKNKCKLAQKYNEIQKEISIYDTSNQSLQHQIDEHEKNHAQKLCYLESINKIQEDITINDQKIDLYKKKGGYSITKDNMYTQQIVDLVEQIENLNQKIGGKTVEYEKSVEAQNKHNILRQKINTEHEKILLKRCYMDVVNPKNGYPNNLIRNGVKLFNKKVNQFVKFANFDFKTTIDTPAFNSKLKRNSNQMLVKHFKNGKQFMELSGAEKFTFNLAILCVLGDILNITSPPLLVVDEGFSCMDDSHINEVPNLLDQIKTQFNYILYITHNDSIKTKGDYFITVNKTDDKSYLT